MLCVVSGGDVSFPSKFASRFHPRNNDNNRVTRVQSFDPGYPCGSKPKNFLYFSDPH